MPWQHPNAAWAPPRDAGSGYTFKRGGQAWPAPSKDTSPEVVGSGGHILQGAVVPPEQSVPATPGCWGGGKGLQAPAKASLSFPPGERL